MIVFIIFAAVILTILCLQHVRMCFTGETTKERIMGKESTEKCYFLRISKQKFNLRYEINEEQVKKIQNGGIEIELSENEPSISN